MRFAQSAHAILRFRVSALVATEPGRPCYRVATQPCRSRRKALQTCSHSSQLLSRKTRAHSHAFAAVRTCVLQSGRQDLNLRPPGPLKPDARPPRASARSCAEQPMTPPGKVSGYRAGPSLHRRREREPHRLGRACSARARRRRPRTPRSPSAFPSAGDGEVSASRGMGCRQALHSSAASDPDGSGKACSSRDRPCEDRCSALSAHGPRVSRLSRPDALTSQTEPHWNLEAPRNAEEPRSTGLF
jgi:hypothetical protein